MLASTGVDILRDIYWDMYIRVLVDMLVVSTGVDILRDIY